MTSRRRRPTAVLLAGLLLVAVSAGCSDDAGSGGGDGSVADTTVPDGTRPQVVSDLVGEGEQVCTDEEGDLTQAAQVQADPAVPQPGLDLLEGRATLDDDQLTATFTMAGPVRPEQQPELVLFIGLVDDMNGFEVQATPSADGVWAARLVTRGVGINRPAVLPTARVTVDGAVVTMVVPRDQVPPIGPNQPVVYGSSGRVMDEVGGFLDERGQPVDGPAAAADVFEECLSFGQ